MKENIDKRVRAQQFRARLGRAMAEHGSTQSGLARDIGVDRSTISQLLKGDGARLPNAHVVGACAFALGVSADWLLSLSDRPESAADLMTASLALTAAPRALVDQQIFDWHREAAGYKNSTCSRSLAGHAQNPGFAGVGVFAASRAHHPASDWRIRGSSDLDAIITIRLRNCHAAFRIAQLCACDRLLSRLATRHPP